jgi:phosphoglycolate phosphatase
MIGAHANGLRAVGVLWGYGSRSELEAAGADALVNTAGDLPGTLVGAAGVGGCGR